MALLYAAPFLGWGVIVGTTVVWMLVIVFAGTSVTPGGGRDHIPTASESACNAARTAMAAAIQEERKMSNLNGVVRAQMVAVCVPVEQPTTAPREP